MQKIIDAEKSDLFDVLAHVAYALAPVTREDRATCTSTTPSPERERGPLVTSKVHFYEIAS
jgi:hypothetical protein